MCRLFGMTAGDHRVRATFWLLDDDDSLDLQSHDNPDGTGLGTFDPDGRPVVEKQPLAAYEDEAFHREARDRTSTTFVAHVRHSTGTPATMENTHPFVVEGLVAAHNGEIGELETLDAELGPDLATVRGDTDSERILALVGRGIRRGLGVGEAMVEAARWLAENVPVGALNLVVAGEHDLWALRYPELHELWIVSRDADGAGLRGSSQAGTRVHSDDLAQAPCVVVASERLDDGDDWRLLPPGTLVHVGRDLVVDEQLVLPEPPRRRVSLS